MASWWCCCNAAKAADGLAVATAASGGFDGVPPRPRANSPTVVETFMGPGVLVTTRSDGFNVVELLRWRLSNGTCAIVYVRDVTADPVQSVLLDSANLLEDTLRISGISVGDAV